ncbi:MAG: ATP-binding protein [Roseateles asaccharophilus]|uniref:histidine kinase n=1 Tax=Roseateles asaccharophilus TaxID=582607 RepID=A0A4R6NAW5_9BURK|nr:ATP-binding protein [Roseateles asaccharophilus]MDN3543228.1 ATP-binding protein [Roseateles asaccharophilus]TDP13073.1 PAS/PAC sensor signal transduction histidine kinase [Roseateles asaccharophilus]
MDVPQHPAPAAPPPAPPVAATGWRRWRRALLWGALVALLLVAQTLLVLLTLSYEASKAQEQVELAAAEVAVRAKQLAGRDLQGLQSLLWQSQQDPRWRDDASELLRRTRPLLRLELRDAQREIQDSANSPYSAPLFVQIPREQLQLETDLACTAALRHGSQIYSRSYFVPLPGGDGQEVLDLCLPQLRAGELQHFLVATVGLRQLLESSVPPELLRGYEISFVEGDGTRLARVGLSRGAGVYIAERVVDLPGQALQLRVDSASGQPKLIPNLATALVMGLSLALFAVVLLLARDGRRRAFAEHALAESLSFRQAMENSLITGLRARDMEGRITYVNPAFCKLVGFEREELLGRGAPPQAPPYWPPEHVDEYWRRHGSRVERWEAGQERQGFETVFMRRSGERFPVMIYEAPLVSAQGQQTGWMSAVLDVSGQRKMEELSRQQQERLQATARLATVGEMASLLSHELNQPLAAIASYATASLNLMTREAEDPQTPAMVRQAVTRIAEQAERAGRVIKSVHDFVRRREQAREAVGADQVLEAVLPLVRLQARKSGARIDLDIEQPPPRLRCDRTMVEQVLLNLTRNGIQAMDPATPLAERVLVLRVRRAGPRWVSFAIIDRGPGIAPGVAKQLFTPFFTTRSEGMGLGLSLCRTVVEQHGGAMDFSSPVAEGRGTEFRFTLPADNPAGGAATGRAPDPIPQETDPHATDNGQAADGVPRR